MAGELPRTTLDSASWDLPERPPLSLAPLELLAVVRCNNECQLTSNTSDTMDVIANVVIAAKDLHGSRNPTRVSQKHRGFCPHYESECADGS